MSERSEWDDVHGEHPPGSEEDIPGAAFMSDTAYRESDLAIKFEEFKATHKWVQKLEELGKKAQAEVTANGTRILVTAAVVTVVAIGTREVVKHVKNKKNK